MGILSAIKKVFKKQDVKQTTGHPDGILFADVSHYKPINFMLYDCPAVVTKATEGESMIDGTYQKVKSGAKAKGIKFGAYHFFRCNKSPIKQAEHFIKTAGLDCDFYVLDIETEDGTKPYLIKQLIDPWLKYVHEKTGKLPVIYSGHAFIVSMNLDDSFAKYPLWLARYTSIIPKAPAPWKEWVWWQYSDNAFYNGIGNCDGNLHNKNNSYGIEL